MGSGNYRNGTTPKTVATEGAKFWAGVCSQLANHGIKDVLIVCCDGLTGFPEAIESPGQRRPCKPASGT